MIKFLLYLVVLFFSINIFGQTTINVPSPTGGDDTTNIIAAINSATSGDIVQFQAGNYRVTSTPIVSYAHIYLSGKNNIKLKGAATSGGQPTTTIMRVLDEPNTTAEQPAPIYLRNCVDFNIEDIAFDNEPQHATAGKVTEKGSNYFKVEIFSGLPMVDNTDFTAGNVWDSNKNLKKVSSLSFSSSKGTATIFDEPSRIMKVTLTDTSILSLINVNEYVSWHYGTPSRSMITVRGGTNITLNNTDVYNSLRSGINISYTENVIVKNVDIKPNGNQLACSPRDGIHSSRVKGSYLVENCTFEGTRLDAFVALGTFAKVTEVTDSKTIKIECDTALDGGFEYNNSLPIEFIDQNGEKISVNVSSSNRLTNAVGSVYEIATQTDIPAFVNVGTTVIPNGLTTTSLITRNNNYKNIAGASELLYTYNATSENNTHTNIMYPAVRLGANATKGHAGGKYVIKNSVFTECAWENSTLAYNLQGYIATENNSSSYNDAFLNDITITGNTFTSNSSSTNYAAIELKDAYDIDINNNTFIGFIEPIKFDESTTSDINTSENTYSTRFYVDGSLGTSGSGDSWATAYLTIQEAVDAVGSALGTSHSIYVATGTYTSAITGDNAAVAYGPSNKYISMFGGYPSGGGTQDTTTNPTIIDGQNARVGVWARNLFSIDGFTVRNGYRLNTAGSGVMSFSASDRSLTIKNCIIEDNLVAISSSSNSDIRGGGVFANACEVIIEDSTIRNNVVRTSTASSGKTNSALGGGIYAVNTITITGSTISGNAAICYDSTNGVAGGGIYTPSATAVNVTNSNITGNFTNYDEGATITKREFEKVNITFNGTSNSIEATTVDAGSTVTVTSGASLNVTNSIINNGTVTGDLTYNVNIADTNWHLVASPVSGAGYSDTWITNNNIASGSDFGTNRAISTYDNSSNVATAVAGSAGHWRYTQGGDTGTFGTGVGYGFLKTGTGNISFTGTMPSTVNPAITQGVNNWNMVGNSFPSNMDVAAFIAANTALLTGPSQAIHVWNGSTYAPLTTGYIQPGQAFFIDAANAGNISITQAMQSHQTGVTFYKTDKTSLELSVTDGINTRSTEINYLDNKTKGLDPGFDIRAFDGVNSEFSLTTQLLEDYQDLGFARQALPTSEMESAIVPLGVKAVANKEITFSLNTSNLPSGVNVYLENREENTFTLLTNGDVKITPQKNIDGVGIYYVRLSSKALSTETISLEGVSIYKMNNNTLKINGLFNAKASVKMFTILGKQVLNTSFDATGNNEISLPKLATGVYIVQIQSEQGNLNKKIILE